MLCCGSEEGDLHWFAVGLSIGGAGRGGALGEMAEGAQGLHFREREGKAFTGFVF